MDFVLKWHTPTAVCLLQKKLYLRFSLVWRFLLIPPNTLFFCMNSLMICRSATLTQAAAYIADVNAIHVVDCASLLPLCSSSAFFSLCLYLSLPFSIRLSCPLMLICLSLDTVAFSFLEKTRLSSYCIGKKHNWEIRSQENPTAERMESSVFFVSQQTNTN